jgi:Uma2 family endonuclease
MAVAVRRHRFSVNQWHHMIDAGVFHPTERLELIEGEIIAMAPIGSAHQSAVDRLTHLFVRRLGERAVVRVQGPILLAAQDSEPQPDLALLEPRADFYRSGHPEPRHVFLVVEVMDTTADFDRGVKLGLYARASVAEVWLVDLHQATIEAFRGADAGVYRVSTVARRGDVLSVAVFPEVAFTADEILG